MRKSLSKLGNAKVWCGVLLATALGLLILLVMEDRSAPYIPNMQNEPERVKVHYGEKVGYSRATSLEFPDFDLIYLGTGVSTSGGMHVPIKYYYFRVVGGGQENIVFWTAGTGVIGPIPFEFRDKEYMIEMKSMEYGREDQVKLGENELSISRAD